MTESRRPQSAGALFERLWAELVLLLGTTATATLLRRSIKRAAPRVPLVAELRVEREGLEYACAVPASWRDPGNAAAIAAVRLLYVEELAPMLRELTGGVVRRRLANIPELDAMAAPIEEGHDDER